MILRLNLTGFDRWQLIADQLSNPGTWAGFVPSHEGNSDRYRFETTVRRTAPLSLKGNLIGAGVKRETCVFEYDPGTNEYTAFAHAVKVALELDVDLETTAERIGMAKTRPFMNVRVVA